MYTAKIRQIFRIVREILPLNIFFLLNVTVKNRQVSYYSPVPNIGGSGSRGLLKFKSTHLKIHKK